MFRHLIPFLLAGLVLRPSHAHAPPTPLAAPPLHVESGKLVDANRNTVLLRGVNLPGLNAPAQSDARKAIGAHTFRVIQQRWNMNAVRLPLGVQLWQQEGASYLDRVSAAVDAANAEGLVAVLAAYDDSSASTGLPGSATMAFWSACAQRFKNTPGVIFALFHEPSIRNIPGSASGVHRAQDWLVWRNGGALTTPQSAVGMQSLVDAIRAAGAQQVIAAPAFHDSLEFQGFNAAIEIADPDVIYETHPTYDHGLTDEARDANFGFMLGRYPVFAGSWGMPFGRDSSACRATPRGLAEATDLLFQTVAYFDRRSVSWAVADFEPGSLVQNLDDEIATEMNGRWTCDAASDPRAGIGQFILLFMTGDAYGFGSLDAALIASAAAGYGGEALVPGEILSIFGQVVGPAEPAFARLTDAGTVDTTAGEVRVFFDGIAAPVLLAGGFQVNVQVPYEISGRESTRIQLVYRGVESNPLTMSVAPVGPGVFVQQGTTQAAALNQDNSVNGSSNPAVRGSVVSLFSTGCGQTSPPGATGVPAREPLPSLTQTGTITIGGQAAEVLYGGPAPGLVGVTQWNVRIPETLPAGSSTTRLPVVLKIAAASSRSDITLWIR